MILKWGKIFFNRLRKRFLPHFEFEEYGKKSVHTMIKYGTIVLIEKMEE